MPNPAKAIKFEVTLEDADETEKGTGGRPAVYWLEFGWAALAELEDHFGGGEMLDRIKKPTIRDMLFIFQSGLTKHQPDITEEETIEVMDALGKPGVMTQMSRAFELAFKDDEPEPKPKAKPRAQANGHDETEAGEAIDHPPLTPNRATRRRITAEQRHT